MTFDQARRLVTALEEHVSNLIALEAVELGSHDLGVALQQSQGALIDELMNVELEETPR